MSSTGDTLSILRHPTSALAKTWNADGSVTGYGDAKYFALREVEITSLSELSELLSEIADQPNTVLIRGKYVGDNTAQSRDGSEFKTGKVRRALDYFDDQPLHTLLIDIDKFEPMAANPLEDPKGAIEEYVQTMLPEEFSSAGYHYQLSNSAGHPTKGATLNAHVWFWLEAPLTSAQVRAYAAEVSLAADAALFNPVQAHYTANPVFAAGVTDPVAAAGVARTGFVQGLLGDDLLLSLSAEAMAAGTSGAGGGFGAGRAQRMRDQASADPIVQALEAAGSIKSHRKDGGINIVCPFADDHTGESGETATQYFPPNTGGYPVGNFKCLHAHCLGRTRLQFLSRLGVDEMAAESFDPVQDSDSDGEDAGSDAANGTRAKAKSEKHQIPEAQHLCTDLSNANRIAKHFGKRLIVIAGDWYTWTGTHWKKDDADVYRDTCQLSKIIKTEAASWLAKKAKNTEEAEDNKAIAKALTAWSTKCENKAAIESAIGLLRKMMSVPADSVNSNPWLLNCKNGTIDLRTSTLKPHDPADRITLLLELDYDPEATCDVWGKALSQITLEHDLGESKPVASFMQRWYGYCATGSIREHKFIVHYGQGSNGKSTILDTVARVLGPYADGAAPGLLMASNSDRHPTEIAALFGRRMITAHETGEGGLLREEFIKQATGGDIMKGRFMRADFFSFSPTHKLQMVTNYKPGIKGQDHGIWRRILLCPYQARFGTKDDVDTGRAHFVKDNTLVEKLAKELPGILTWIVQGAKSWFRDGLQEPDIVRMASNDYQSEQDRVMQFVTECCECDKVSETPLTGSFGLLEAYRNWCKEAGFNPVARLRFVGELARIVVGFKVDDIRTGQHGSTNRKQIKICTGLRLLEVQ